MSSGLSKWQDWDAVLESRVRRALNKWAVENEFDVGLRGWFTAGHSSEPVAVLSLSREGAMVRQVVAKFYREAPEQAARLIARVHSDAPDEFKRHLVSGHLEPIQLQPDCWCFMQDVAGGDWTAVRPLTEVVASGLIGVVAVEDLAASLVGDWNHGSALPAPTDEPLGELLRSILGRRLLPGQGITRWATSAGVSLCGDPILGRSREFLSINPFALLSDPLVSEITVPSVIRGRAHGDLSGRNILVPIDPPQPDGFKLIDLDRYATAAPLARDPMHLLVALAIDRFRDSTPTASEQEALLKALADPGRSSPSVDPHSFESVVRAVYRGSRRLALQSGYGGDWAAQCQVAVVAAALMHLGRDLRFSNQTSADRESAQDEAKWWCLELAAQAASHFVHLRQARDSYAPTSIGERSDDPEADAVPGSVASHVQAVVHDRLRLVVAGLAEDTPMATQLRRHLDALPVELLFRTSRGVHNDDSLASSLSLTDLVLHVPASEDSESEQARAILANAAAQQVPVLSVMHTSPERLQTGSGPDKWERALQSGTFNSASSQSLVDAVREIASPQFVAMLCESRREHARSRYPSVIEGAYRRARADLAYFDSRARLEHSRSKGQLPQTAGTPHGQLSQRTGPPTTIPYFGAPPRLPLDLRLNRGEEYGELVQSLASSSAPVCLLGSDGIGLTALTRALFDDLQANKITLQYDCYVYLTCQGPYPFTAGHLLEALAHLVPDPSRSEALIGKSNDSKFTWSELSAEIVAALDGTQVLLVIDDVSAMLDEDRRPAETNLRNLLAMLAVPSGPVQMLFVGKCAPSEPDSVRCSVDMGLGEPHASELLAHMDADDSLDFALGDERSRRDIVRLSDGYPRVMELVFAVLRGDSTSAPPSNLIRRVTSQETGSVLRPLWNAALANLDRVERRVLLALAVFGRPVDDTAVDFLLAPLLPGVASRPVLDEMARRRLIVKSENRFALSRDGDDGDRLVLLDSLPQGHTKDRSAGAPGFSKIGLAYRAASFYDRQPIRPKNVDDLSDLLARVELLVESCAFDEALKEMAAIEERYLDGWGAGAAFQRTRGLLNETMSSGPARDEYLVIHNLSRLGNSFLQQGDAAVAVRYFGEATDRAEAAHRRRTFNVAMLQLGSAQLVNGDSAAAQQSFKDVVADSLHSGHSVVAATALVGLSRIDLQRGHFDAGLVSVAQGLTLLEEQRGRDAQTIFDPAKVRADLLVNRAVAFGCMGRHSQAQAVLYEAGGYLSNGDVVRQGGLDELRARLFLDEGDVASALRCAKEAVEKGARTGNRNLITEAAVALTLAQLISGRHSSARDSARHAVNFSSDALTAIPRTLLGLSMLFDRNPAKRGEAALPLHQGFNRARRLVASDGRHWSMQECAGLASLGLSLVDVSDRSARLVDAQVHLRQAREAAPQLTLGNRMRTLLGALRPAFDALGDSYNAIQRTATGAETSEGSGMV